MISRRSFLIGLGSLVTSAFVAQAGAYALENGTPLLLDFPPLVDAPDHVTLYLEAFEDEFAETSGKWRISLGEPWCQDPPDTPTWRSYLGLDGRNTPDRVERACRAAQIDPDQLDSLLPEESWCTVWEHSLSPQARAFEFLDRSGLSCPLNRRGDKAGRMMFIDGGWRPGSSERWVELKDDLSVALLQARAMEHSLPVSFVLLE